MLSKARGLTFVSRWVKACYYSSFKSSDDLPILEVLYNLYGNHIAGIRTSSIDFANEMKHNYRPVYFRYDLATAQSTYLISKEEPLDLTALRNADLPRIHPFTIHLALLSREVEECSESTVQILSGVVAIENRLLLYEATTATAIPPNTLRYELRNLHNIARLFVSALNRNRRMLQNIKKITKDLDRLNEKLAAYPSCPQLDADIHNRVKDGLFSIEVGCCSKVRVPTHVI